MFLQLWLCPALGHICGFQSRLQQHWLHLAGNLLHPHCFPQIKIFPGVRLQRLSPGVSRGGHSPAKLNFLCHGNCHGLPGQMKNNKNNKSSTKNISGFDEWDFSHLSLQPQPSVRHHHDVRHHEPGIRQNLSV